MWEITEIIFSLNVYLQWDWKIKIVIATFVSNGLWNNWNYSVLKLEENASDVHILWLEQCSNDLIDEFIMSNNLTVLSCKFKYRTEGPLNYRSLLRHLETLQQSLQIFILIGGHAKQLKQKTTVREITGFSFVCCYFHLAAYHLAALI